MKIGRSRDLNSLQVRQGHCERRNVYMEEVNWIWGETENVAGDATFAPPFWAVLPSGENYTTAVYNEVYRSILAV